MIELAQFVGIAAETLKTSNQSINFVFLIKSKLWQQKR
jgi:hypothetical protein